MADYINVSLTPETHALLLQLSKERGWKLGKAIEMLVKAEITRCMPAAQTPPRPTPPSPQSPQD